MTGWMSPGNSSYAKMATQECQDMAYDAVTGMQELIRPYLAKEPSKAPSDPSQPDTEGV